MLGLSAGAALAGSLGGRIHEDPAWLFTTVLHCCCCCCCYSASTEYLGRTGMDTTASCCGALDESTRTAPCTTEQARAAVDQDSYQMRRLPEKRGNSRSFLNGAVFFFVERLPLLITVDINTTMQLIRYGSRVNLRRHAVSCKIQSQINSRQQSVTAFQSLELHNATGMAA